MLRFPQLPFDVKHENLTVEKASLKGITEISWDGEYQDPPQPLPADGKFKKPYTLRFLFSDPITRKVVVVEKKFPSFDLTEVTVAQKEEGAPPIEGAPSAPAGSARTIVDAGGTNSLIYYLALAFVGGLILNIMPCVLPV